MGAAARREVEPLDVDQPQRAPARRFLAQRQPRRLRRVREPDRHRPILPDDPVRFRFRGRNLGRRHLAREIDRRDGRAEMKADRPRAEQLVERRRQHVLSGVLLHVVEPPGPVDLSVDHVARSRFPVLGVEFGHVRDRPVLFVHDVDDAEWTEQAGVERLAARRRIERRAVEREGEAIVAPIDPCDRGVKGPEIRVGVIEAVGHRASTIPFWRTRTEDARPAR